MFQVLQTLMFLVVSRKLFYTYNIDVEHPVVYRGPNGTFFGYSVLEHYHDNTRWVLVGAPKAESRYSNFMQSPGAVFKCRVHTNPERQCTELDMGRDNIRGSLCGKSCKEDRDNEWMGVSLARQRKTNGSVLACAHRWKNIYYEAEVILPHGFCLILSPNLQASVRKLIPCYEDHTKKFGEGHGSCQAGISGFFTEEVVVIGAPGSYLWTGTVKVLNVTGAGSKWFSLKESAAGTNQFSYLGYAVTAGHFSHPTSTDIVGGAPQADGYGKIYIYRFDKDSLTTIFQTSGKKMGSYFGSSLCAVDLNKDGLSDLLVGAPMFTEIRDEGQVTVYLSKGNGLLEEQLVLNGENSYNAHFGEAIALLGDIDDDGFPDVAVGAPKEDDFTGAIYIYHGDAGGIVACYSMRLSGQRINPVLQMFGQSISGEVDMDGNGYPDITVGAYLTDTVVLLRTRPVITVVASIVLPVSINITSDRCHDGVHQLSCIKVSVCFCFHGKEVPGKIGLNYHLTADVAKKEKGLQSRLSFILSGEMTSQITDEIQLSHMMQTCKNYTVYVKQYVKDVISPIVFEAAYSLRQHIVPETDKELPALQPILRWHKGENIAQRNQTVFERNCRSDDCTADLKIQGKLLLSSTIKQPMYLALGEVKNVSLNIIISNLGDDAYDASVSFNFSKQLFFIKVWQNEEKGISCELLEVDFLKCSVGFPFMRWKSKYQFSVFFDTTHLSGEEEALEFQVTAQSTVLPTLFVYGDSTEASRFIKLEDSVCLFQPLNLSLQVINTGPSSLPGATVHILIPNRLLATGTDVFLVLEATVGEGQSCSFHVNPTPCVVPQENDNIFHTISAFFKKSGRKVLDCDRPGRSCLIISCYLNYLTKEEIRNINVHMLLNTEILKKDSSSVIQFVTRAFVRVETSLRVIENPDGLPDDVTMVFEALHNLEPRGYVVGWIIAISLLLGIIAFLFLAVLLWKMGFFRRRYKEIIDAEKKRKDSEESWDWFQRNY
ncbi:integrin alpha-9 isoform X2 [Protopterus annectens]|uniref:integrin alpha-9 isoform X2 n=1 Tax=Protopterus annectens TaxID=7888 RepID=UPI001CFB2307|nr:integrin alpha-9 isoform X2 [Protopterus annectens]